MHVRKDRSELFEVVEHMCKFIRPEAFPELQPKDDKTAESTDWLADIKKNTGKDISIADLDDIDIIERIR